MHNYNGWIQRKTQQVLTIIEYRDWGFHKARYIPNPIYKVISSPLQKKKKKKFERYHFWTVRTFIFPLKVVSKLFSIMPPMNNFGFKQFETLFLSFSKNSFNVVTQNLQKSWKFPFWNDRAFALHVKVSSKTFS